MQEPIPTAKTPFGWRRARLVAGTLALSMAAFGSLAAVTVGSASAASFSALTTQNYTIGSPSSQLSNVTVAVSPSTGNSTGNYSVKFTTSAALVGATSSSPTITVAVTAPANQPPFPTALTTVGLVDQTSGTVITTPATNTGSLSSPTTTFTFTLTAGTIGAGDTALLTFQAVNPNVAGTSAQSYSVDVTSSVSTSALSTLPTLSISPATPGVALTTSTNYLGAYATYTFTNVPSDSASGTSPQTLNLGVEVTPTGGTINWSGASVSVTDTTAASGAVSVAVSSISGSNGTTTPDELTATLSLTGTVGADDHFTVTVGNVKNPTVVGETDTLAAVISTAPPTFAAADDASPTVTFGSFVSGVAVTPSNTAASATGVTYTVNFVSTDGVPASDWIQFVGPDGTSFSGATGAVVTDNKSGATTVVPSASLAVSTTTNSNDTVKITLPANFTISSGDSVTVTVFNVTNPASGSYSGSTGLQVTTQVDSISQSNATPYVIGAATISSLAPTVTVSPITAGALATYTITGFKAVSQLVAGTDTIEVSASDTATTFPATGYTLMDVTSGASQSLTVNTGPYTHDVKLNLTTNVAAGDSLSLVITSVVNPITASSTDTITLGADSNSNNATAAGTQGLGSLALSFPSASTSYPDGAIVFFGGTAYVFAGGHAFGAPNPASLAAVQAVDPATVQTAASGVTVPTAGARPGTMVIVAGKPTIYVVGTDGDLHGFASPTQIFALGFDAAFTITVPSLGGLTVSTSDVAQAGLTGFSTSSDGAIVNSSGTFYVFAGGKAFGIPGAAKLNAIAMSEPPGSQLTPPAPALCNTGVAPTPTAECLAPSSGTVTSAMQSATIASGVVVTYGGGVFATNSGSLFPFKGPKQLAADGYGGTPSVIIPNLGGLAIASYTGS
jgi:hypothetical protein